MKNNNELSGCIVTHPAPKYSEW